MERGGPRRSACIDALTLPLFLASSAFDRRTASADGFPSLIPSLPDSTTVEQPATPFHPTPHSLAKVGIEEPTPQQSSDDTRIADLTTAHHNFIPIKHRSYPNTVNYYLDSTNYRLTKTKTDKLTQRLAEFSYMHAYHSFQSELCSGCLSSARATSCRA